MIVPFMNFHGQCEAAVLYYQSIFKFEDPFFLKFNQVRNLAFTIPEDYGNKVMFTEFMIADQKIFACDVYPGMPSHAGQSISLNVIHSSLEDIQTWFDALSKEGVVGMPIQATHGHRNTVHARINMASFGSLVGTIKKALWPSRDVRREF